jgi:hypothetical protein
VRLERVLEDRGDRDLRLLAVEVVDERRRLADHVRVVVQDVDGRLVRLERRLRRPHGDRGRRARPASRSASNGAAGPSEERSGRRTGEQQPSDHQGGDADDRRAGCAEERADDPFEPAADEPAVLGAEREQEAQREDDETGAERPDVHELAARDHQQAEHDERSGRDVRGRADRAAQTVLDRAPDDASLPAEPEERREEDPCGGEDESPELGMVVSALALLAPALLDPSGNARAQGALTLLARHGRGFDAPPYSPPSQSRIAAREKRQCSASFRPGMSP